MDELILNSLHGRTTPEEERELLAWRSASPENDQYYDQLVRLLEAVAVVAAPDAEPFTPSAADLLTTAAVGESDSVALGRRRRRRTRSIAFIGSIAAAFVLAVGSLYYTQRSQTLEFRMGSGEYVSGSNESTTATLADGTIVRMAPNSRLRILDLPERREVDLEGHAFFAVARMPEQPFTVRTPIGDVTALGTRFDVRVGEDLRVVVAEGRVAIGDDDQRVEVEAGEMSLIADGRVTQPVRVDVRSLLAWMGRFIAFQSTPLSLVAAELEAEYGTRVVIADPLLAELTITGSYIDRSFEDVITMICGAISAECSIEDGTATIGR